MAIYRTVSKIPIFTWATKPAASTFVGEIRISDVGFGGSDWYSNGVSYYPKVPVILANNYTPYTTSNGTASEILIAPITLPPGILQVGSGLKLSYSLAKSGAVEVATVQHRLGTDATGLTGTIVAFNASISATFRNFANVREFIISSTTAITDLTAASANPYVGTANVDNPVKTIANVSNTLYLSATCTKTTGGIETLTSNASTLYLY